MEEVAPTQLDNTVYNNWLDALIAEKELGSNPLTDAQLTFLCEMVDLHGTSYYGDRMFDGWYPKLYWHTAMRR